MKIEVDITRSKLLLIIGIIVVFFGLLFVYAYNSSPANPSVFGHSTSEISPPNSNCANKALIWNGSGWDCGYVQGFSNILTFRGGYATVYWTVPNGVQRLNVKCWGAGGGNSGGGGAYAEKIIAVSGGDSIGISIGQESMGDGGRTSVFVNSLPISQGLECGGGKTSSNGGAGGVALYGDVNINGTAGPGLSSGQSGYSVYGAGGSAGQISTRGAVLIYY